MGCFAWGVYVPISEFTSPNPVLDFLPDRDIIIEGSGDTLTLVNPAYMTRQVLEIAAEQYGVKGHITSLRPIRTGNEPDPWEREALMAFEEGAKDYSEIVTENEDRFLRYMHPMIVEESCMKCHETQGYVLGEIRGGVSVSVPLDKYDAIAAEKNKQLAYSHGLIYLFIVFLTYGFYRRHLKELRKKEEIQVTLVETDSSLKAQNNAIKKLNEEYQHQNQKLQQALDSLKNDEEELIRKNHDLELLNKQLQDIENRLEFALSSIKTGSWELNLIDQTALRTIEHDRIFGYDHLLDSWTFSDFLKHVIEEDQPLVIKSFDDALAQKKIWDFECRILRTDGQLRWIHAIGKQFFDQEGNASKMAGVVQDITDQKNKTKEIEHWQRLLEIVIHHDPSSIVVFDKNLNFIFVSEKFVEAYNLQGLELIGKHHYDVFPDLPEKWREVHRLALKGQVSSNDDDPYETEDGTVVYTRWQCLPWYDPYGEIGGIIIYTEVIDAWKQIEMDMRNAKERAEESEKMLKQAQMIARMGNWEYNIATNTMKWSDELYRLLGHEPHEFTPSVTTFLNYVPDEEKEKLKKTFEDSLLQACQLEFEHSIITHDGTQKFVLEKSETLADDEGKVTSVVGIVMDITTQKKAEQTISEYGKVMDESLNEIFIIDVESLRFIQVNKGARNNLGYSNKEFMDMTPADINKYISGDKMKNILQPLLNGEDEIIILTTQHVRKDGTEYPAEVHIQKALFNQKPVFSVFVADITERVKYENALKETNASLQDLVYVTSHDLQVPLVSMEGYASELLQNYGEKLDEEGLYCLTRLQSNAQRMHKLVLSLLDLSRLNTVKNPFHLFNVLQVLEKIVKDLALTIEKNKVTIALEQMPDMEADLQRIESVFRNLIVNSIVYEAKNIKVFYKDHIIYFKDDGIGIPPDQLERIFAPGERLKISKADGVGMGLTFCKKVIDQHQGRIWAESEGIGKGATIAIDLSNNIVKH